MGLVAARAATFATNGGNPCAAFAGDVANVAAIACAKSGLASMARTSSAMLLPCAEVSTGSKLWPRHNA